MLQTNISPPPFQWNPSHLRWHVLVTLCHIVPPILREWHSIRRIYSRVTFVDAWNRKPSEYVDHNPFGKTTQFSFQLSSSYILNKCKQKTNKSNLYTGIINSKYMLIRLSQLVLYSVSNHIIFLLAAHIKHKRYKHKTL